MSRNKLNNDTMEREREQMNSRNEWKDNRTKTFSNNSNNIIKEQEIEQQKRKSESKNNIDSISRNNVDKNTIKHEFELMTSINQSKGKRVAALRKNVDKILSNSGSNYRAILLSQSIRQIIFRRITKILIR